MRAVGQVLSIVAGAGIGFLISGTSALAQEAWLQIEAKNSLAQAEERARDWAGSFPQIAGFKLRSGWYAIAIGPFADPQAARDERRNLRRDGLIPSDSFVTEGQRFEQQFWPVGAALTGTAPITEAQVQPDATANSAMTEADLSDPESGVADGATDMGVGDMAATDGTDPGVTPPETVASTPGADAPEVSTTAPQMPGVAVARTDSTTATTADMAPDTAEAANAGNLPETTTDLAAAAPAPAPQPPETLAESRQREAALDSDTKKEIQRALAWEGTYDSAIDGLFGPGTRSAIAQWQLDNDFEPTGVLASVQQMELLDKVAAERAKIGLEEVNDTEAGIKIDLPLGLVQFARYNAPFVSYVPKDRSGVQVLLISQNGDAARLRGLYDAMQSLEIVPVSGERALHSNGFKIEGVDERVHAYVEASLSKGLIKGFALIWPASDDQRMSRVLDTMKKSFTPIGDTALDATMGQPMSITRAALMAGIEKRKPIFARSGFYVDGRGSVLTAADGLKSCGRITIDDHPATVATLDAEDGLAVLKPGDPLAPREVAKFRIGEPTAGVRVAVAGFSYPEVMPSPVLSFGPLTALEGLDNQAHEARLDIATKPGDVGGPVLDFTGAVIGMVLPRPDSPNRMLPDGLSRALQATVMAPALSKAGFAPEASDYSGARAPEDLQKIADGMVVQVSCWK